MKINEKNLINFATSKTLVDKEGWLQKKGEVNKSFQRRWFVLKGNLLFYFEKKGEKEPVGLVILEGCTIELAENEEVFAFKVVFHGASNRSYILCADSQENMEVWMKALACASYDYMKLMVAELQRQLDEIAEAERQAKLGNRRHQPLSFTGLPVNRSDSCLCSHQNSGRNDRFNPFDRWKNDGNFPATRPVSNLVAGRSSTGRVQHVQVGAATNQRRSFIELHEHYGRQFRKYLQEQREKYMLHDMLPGPAVKEN